MVMELIQRYEQGGQLRKISAEELTVADNLLGKKLHRSNDRHILTLALASEARVLCSDDRDRHADFKDKEILPPMGRRPRIVYPVHGNDKRRREFLDRQRCTDRRQN